MFPFCRSFPMQSFRVDLFQVILACRMPGSRSKSATPAPRQPPRPPATPLQHLGLILPVNPRTLERKAPENDLIAKFCLDNPRNFNGAGAESSGKPGGAARVTLRALGFNGAGAESSGKRIVFVNADIANTAASMGPERKAPENLKTNILERKQTTLQWGRSGKLRKTCACRSVSVFYERLQWGRSGKLRKTV